MATLRKQKEEFTVPEASAILGLTAQSVNNALDRDLKPFGVARFGNGSRTITSEGLVALELLRALAKLLSLPSRQRVIREALRTPCKAAVSLREGIVVSISEYTARVNKGKARLRRAEALVLSSPEVLSGEPCIRGTRVPAHLIGALAREHGMSKARAIYPFLTEEQVELVSLYVAAHPRRGRPPQTQLPKAKAPARRGRSRKVKLWPRDSASA